MKRLNKRILTVCLALMMTVVMAVPAFAAEIQPYASVYQPYYIRASNAVDKALSASTGNSTAYLAAFDEVDNQRWTIGRYNSTLKLYADATIGTGQQSVLTVSATLGDVHLGGEGERDFYTSVDFHTVSGDTARIYFDRCNRYLQANTSYSDVSAALYADGQTRQVWLLTNA